MTGTHIERISRLILHLAGHPWEIGRYLRYSLLSKKSPADLELPWISWGAIDELRRHVGPGSRVFEYGCGGSTVFFARLGATVLSAENASEWQSRVSAILHEKGLSDHARVLLFDDPMSPETFRKSGYLNASSGETWDVVLIDGYTDFSGFRPDCLEVAWPLVRPGGMLVFDDIWMFPGAGEWILRHGGRIYRGIGPCRPGVTDTAILRKEIP